MKKNLKLIIIILLIAIIVFFSVVFLSYPEGQKAELSNSSDITSVEADYTASFAIYTNGTFRIFTNSMYHELSPDAFINSENPNTVNIKKANLTWRDFFNTLPFKLDENCLTTGTGQTFCTNENFTLQFFINGKLAPNALDQIIHPEDKLLITYDKPNSDAINEQLSSFLKK